MCETESTTHTHTHTHTHSNSQPQDGKSKAQEEEPQHQHPSKGTSLIADSGVDLVVAGGAVDCAGVLTEPAQEANGWSEAEDICTH